MKILLIAFYDKKIVMDKGTNVEEIRDCFVL
jgi:hypothetical protein